jgi:hypothetical protein
MCKEDTAEALVYLIESFAEAWKAHPEGEKYTVLLSHLLVMGMQCLVLLGNISVLQRV